MEDHEIQEIARIRALQHSDKVIAHNLEQIRKWGTYNLIKVSKVDKELTEVAGYITLLQCVSGLTPAEMRRMLGLRDRDLADGAHLYRLTELPTERDFLPRGYTTLPDGLRLPAGQTRDANGYRPGLGAIQWVLTKPMPAILIARLKPEEKFNPGVHPKYRNQT